MNEDILTELNEGLEYYKKHRTSRPFSRLLVRVGDECLPLLERIYVNNYELSDWEWWFLKAWIEDPNKPYILSGPFLHSLGIGNIPIFYNFFGPYNGQMSITMFIEFICIFTFFSVEQLLPLLISLGNIKSNRVITEIQISHFFTSLQTPPEKMEKITLWLFDVKKDENGFISLDTFTKYVLNDSLSFLQPFIFLKNQLISNIIGSHTYDNIILRMSYYQANYGDTDRIIMKQESCFQLFQRSLFTSSPPPYFYNYRPSIHTLSFDEIICSIRKRYGYSTRPRGNSSLTFSSASRILKKGSARESVSSLQILGSINVNNNNINHNLKKNSVVKKMKSNKITPSVDDCIKNRSLPTNKLRTSCNNEHKTLESLTAELS